MVYVAHNKKAASIMDQGFLWNIDCMVALTRWFGWVTGVVAMRGSTCTVQQAAQELKSCSSTESAIAV